MTSSSALRLSDVTAREVQWLWPGYVPMGAITIIEGDPSTGKSTIGTELAVRAVQGRAMPDGEYPPNDPRPGIVIWAPEDSLDSVVKPRFVAAGGEPSAVLIQPLSDLLGRKWAELLEQLERDVFEVGARVVLIDSLMGIMPATTNTWLDADVRRVLGPLNELATRLNVAILGLRHTRKSSEGKAVHAGGGSIAFSGVARSVLLVAKHPQVSGRGVMAVVKSNHSKTMPSLGFEIEERLAEGVRTNGIKWLGTEPYEADQLLAPPRRTAELQAKEFLLEFLADGPKTREQIRLASEVQGISKRTLERASSLLNISKGPDGFQGGWAWSLAAADPTPVPEWGQPSANGTGGRK